MSECSKGEHKVEGREETAWLCEKENTFFRNNNAHVMSLGYRQLTFYPTLKIYHLKWTQVLYL